MNLFADLLAATQKEQGQVPQSAVTQTGPRIQKSRRGVEVKSAREIETMRQASRIVATLTPKPKRGLSGCLLELIYDSLMEVLIEVKKQVND